MLLGIEQKVSNARALLESLKTRCMQEAEEQQNRFIRETKASSLQNVKLEPQFSNLSA